MSPQKQTGRDLAALSMLAYEIGVDSAWQALKKLTDKKRMLTEALQQQEKDVAAWLLLALFCENDEENWQRVKTEPQQWIAQAITASQNPTVDHSLIQDIALDLAKSGEIALWIRDVESFPKTGALVKAMVECIAMLEDSAQYLSSEILIEFYQFFSSYLDIPTLKKLAAGHLKVDSKSQLAKTVCNKTFIEAQPELFALYYEQVDEVFLKTFDNMVSNYFSGLNSAQWSNFWKIPTNGNILGILIRNDTVQKIFESEAFGEAFADEWDAILEKGELNTTLANFWYNALDSAGNDSVEQIKEGIGNILAKNNGAFLQIIKQYGFPYRKVSWDVIVAELVLRHLIPTILKDKASPVKIGGFCDIIVPNSPVWANIDKSIFKQIQSEDETLLKKALKRCSEKLPEARVKKIQIHRNDE